MDEEGNMLQSNADKVETELKNHKIDIDKLTDVLTVFQ
jgi:maltodextrin utilization protein YvdJ